MLWQHKGNIIGPIVFSYALEEVLTRFNLYLNLNLVKTRKFTKIKLIKREFMH